MKSGSLSTLSALSKLKISLILNLFRESKLRIGKESTLHGLTQICVGLNCKSCNQKELCNEVYSKSLVGGVISVEETQELYELYPEIKLIS